jgi:hypothetical protein
MKNSFLYTNAKGKRSLTPFAWALIGIAFTLIVVVTAGTVRANATRAVVESGPQPLPSVTATSLPEPTIQTSAVDGCPKDPAQWNFVDVSPDSNYKRIEPACVYDNLARTVAWRILSSAYGYDIADAGNMLGFGSYSLGGVVAPYHEFEELVVRPFQGESVATIAPLYPPMDRGLHFWEVGPNKEVLTATHILQGCFPTYDVVGNQKQYIWDAYEMNSYEAVCQVAYDAQPGGWYIADYGENIVYSDVLESGRALMYFGYYQPEGTWYFLGLSNENTYTASPESLAAEYSLMQEWYGALVWDDAWFRSYNIPAAPLPEGWEKRNTSADLQAISERIAKGNP